jgi:C4-dicarboxylate-specific signal transduction histidine kinase
LGAFSIVSMYTEIPWTADSLPRFSVLADVFANAIVRKRGDAELRRSTALSDAVLRSMGSQVCVLDKDGRIVAVNDAWKLAADEPAAHVACLLIGSHCAVESGEAAPCATPEATRAQRAIRDVLAGRQQAYSMEYRVKTPTLDNWFLLTVEPLRLSEGGVVISHQNITSRKRSELEAEQRRQELAHVSRVSTMGQLAASIAHELNQPLTGVLTNAQAAMRYLAHDPPNVDEVRDILNDIIEDDRRAGEVIRRLRSMLQTGEIEPAEIDMQEIVAEVLRLLGSDAVLRNVAIETECIASVPKVRGDKIQLQQVILNLVVNAMDAMKGREAPDRRVTIRIREIEDESVEVSVSDCGHGIEPDNLGRIFQPFYTTKSDGMGMGLSIARTIVEAHGGMLWASNNTTRGATLHCRFPAAEVREGPG